MGSKIATQQRSAERTVVPTGRTSTHSLSSRSPGHRLQEAIGNAATARLFKSGHIQPKLTVSHPEDESEREADRVADQVMRMPEPQSSSTILQTKPSIQRACLKCEDELQRKPDFAKDTLPEEEEVGFLQAKLQSPSAAEATHINRSCDHCEDELQRKAQPESGEETLLSPKRQPDSTELSKLESARPHSIQAKVTVSRPGDEYELEADRIADQVMGMSSHRSMSAETSAPQISRVLAAQREYSQGQKELQREPLTEPDPKSPAEEKAALVKPADDEGHLQRKVKGEEAEGCTSCEEEEHIQTKEGAGGTNAGVAKVESRIGSMSGGGERLPEPTRKFFENRFGRDFSNVRVHTDSSAIQMNREISARAFTHQEHIYFNAGEYPPTTEKGRHILAHELTHTIQQGAGDDLLQRFSAPEQDVALDPKPNKPDDGAQVEGRMNAKIENDENVQNQDDLDEEEREEAKHPNRGEVRQEAGQINASGESKPTVDRGAAAEQKTEAQKAQLAEELPKQAPEAEEEKGKGKEEKAKLSKADAAAQKAKAAEQKAQVVEIPAQPAPFKQPRIQAPVDKAGEPLPRNSQIDTQVRGLGEIGSMLRVKGYQMKVHAADLKTSSYEQDAWLFGLRADLALAEEGTAAFGVHNEARHTIAEQSREAHGESVERQQFVAEKAPDLASKADEGKSDSSELATEARGKADQSKNEIPDDEDAKADAEQQSTEMQNSAQQAESMDEAITKTGERARQYEQDAILASQQNHESEAQIGETEKIIAETDARIAEMNATNLATQGRIEKASAGPGLVRRYSQQTAKSGDELIAATIVMEQELNDLQEEYLADMKGIESREDATKRQQKEQEQKKPEKQAELSPQEQQLVELAGLSEDKQDKRIAGMDQRQRDGLMSALDKMIQETPDTGTDKTEGARRKVDTGLSKAIMGQEAADPRAEKIQKVENQRIQRVGGVLDIADQNMNFLTAEQQRMLANKLVVESITDDIKNISVLKMGKDMLKAMVDPRAALVGVVGGFEKMLTGFANIGNAEAWARDPVGNLLQIGADITTGLATIFSGILGIAALITAVMVALTIFSWGTLLWLTGPVIAWMGTIMTYAGWGAIICGGLAVYFNYLAYIKNLHDAGTAETARELFGNTEQMKQNATDGFQGAMAVVEGIGAVKMGPKLSSGEFLETVPRTPTAFAKQTIKSVRGKIESLASAPGRFARGAAKLLAGGRQGLRRFKERLRALFGRRRPGHAGVGDLDVETPHAKQQHQSHLDEARNKQVHEMDESQLKAEMQELGEHQPKRIEPGSEHFDNYDVEIESNGHTYRRRRDGKGWCRFTEKECGIGNSALPDKVKEQTKKLDADGTAAKETAEGKKAAVEKKYPSDPPAGYEWYTDPDGNPKIRNKAGNNGPVKEYDPKTGTFIDKPDAPPKPDVLAVEAEKAKLSHKDLEGSTVVVTENGKTRVVSTKDRLKELEAERLGAQKRKETAIAAGDEAAAGKAHGEMIRASEELGEVATDAAVKKEMPNAKRLDSELPGAQQTGEFDRVYKDGDQVYIYESKGAGSQRGSRKTDTGLRAEQGTPQYREDIVLNMEKKIKAHKMSPEYQNNPQFKAKIDNLQETVKELRQAEQAGKLHYKQVTQKVDVHGVVKDEIEIITFGKESTPAASAAAK